jgi:alkanesulfonate monooxygenase SsuD/methylene tetrahydromethanopterin reductase-like flavin-dependent oxidoreductase (luciferase family)
MSLFGVDPERTYAEVEESLRIIANVWREDLFEWHGLLDIDPHPVLPHPVQNPHPPLFMASTKQNSLELAAEYGVGPLVFGFAGVDEVAHLHEVYQNAIAGRDGSRFVSTEVNDHFGVLCPTIVLDDPEEALRIGARGQRFFAESITHWYGAGPPPVQDTLDDDNVQAIKADAEAVVARLHEAKIPVNPNTVATYNVSHAYGDAQGAIEYVELLEAAGATEIMCMIQMGTVPQEICMETIQRWGDTIIPHFRAKEAAASTTASVA